MVESKSFTSWTRVNLQPSFGIMDLNMVLSLLDKNMTPQVELVLTQISYGTLGLQQTLFWLPNEDMLHLLNEPYGPSFVGKSTFCPMYP